MGRVLRQLGQPCHPVARSLHGPAGPAGLSLLGWHHVDHRLGLLSVTADELDAQLDSVVSWGAEVLGLEQARAAVAGGTLPRRVAVMTFDDRYQSTLDVALPRLKARGWPSTLYVAWGYLAGQNLFPWNVTEGDRAPVLVAGGVLEAARRGMHVGSHTVSHGG